MQEKRLILQNFRAQNVLFCSCIRQGWGQPLSTISINYFYITKNAQPCRSAIPVAMRESPQNGSFEYYSTLHSSPPLLSVPNDWPAAYKKTFRCTTLTKKRSAALHFQKHNYICMPWLIFLSIRGPRHKPSQGCLWWGEAEASMRFYDAKCHL